MTGIALMPWQAVMLRSLSREYAYQANISRDAVCPCPYEVETTDADLETVRLKADQKLRALFSNG